MSRPRFLSDHDVNEHIIDGVLRREPAVEFVRAREVGVDGRPDPEVLEYAEAQGFIVVSHDVNTMPAHAGPCLCPPCCRKEHRRLVDGTANPAHRASD